MADIVSQKSIVRQKSQNLYRVLSPEGNPELRIISLILHTLGYRLSVQPIQS
ncbi:helix-turn-helix domain-containing transcriptional regulator [Nostoc sp.]|uniref:helix-turn-helix domain-containing transcriptional regulator n=1 Tax=Nostoc sp. TaxID=1180 RepID=UPI002FFC595D